VIGALHRTSFAAPWTAEEFALLLEQPGVAGWMWHAPSPLGFILVRAAADEAEILTLAVTPGYRRAGIATALLDQAVRTLRAGGTARLFLEVAADNAAALALYGKSGFERSGLRPAYYARAGKETGGDKVDGEAVDAVTMTLLLAATAQSAAADD
jgi:ribosomal-protein-alanine N-acetyltransferase